MAAFAANYTPEGVKASVADAPTFNAYVARAGEDYARLSPTPDELDGFVGQISQMWTTEPNYDKDPLRAISVPTAIFAGEHDEAIEPAHTAAACALGARRRRGGAAGAPSGWRPRGPGRPASLSAAGTDSRRRRAPRPR